MTPCKVNFATILQSFESTSNVIYSFWIQRLSLPELTKHSIDTRRLFVSQTRWTNSAGSLTHTHTHTDLWFSIRTGHCAERHMKNLNLIYSQNYRSELLWPTENSNKTDNVRVTLITRRAQVTTVAAEKQLSITYSECAFVALVIQHAKRMRRVTVSSMASTTLHHLSTLSHKQHDIRESYWIYNVCFEFLCNFCLKHFSF